MDLLKRLVEELVQASPAYMKKERVRESIQNVIIDLVGSGEIQSAADLENFFSSATMSMSALKMVPFEAYAKLAGKKTPAKPRK